MTDQRKTGLSDLSTLKAAISDQLVQIFYSPIVLSIWVCGTVLAIVAQPFETYGVFPLLPRITYWAVLVGVSILVGNIADTIAYWLTPSGNPVSASAKAIAIVTLVLAPLVILWSQLFSLYFSEMSAPPAKITFFVFMSAGVIFILLAAIRPRLKPVTPRAKPASAGDVRAIQPRLSLRLEDGEARILRLSANDHRIEVVTERGIEHVRLRFADAVNEMHPLKGDCVHRSHWVAHCAVDRLERRKDKLFVILSNGDEIPVSRTYRSRLEAAMPELF